MVIPASDRTTLRVAGMTMTLLADAAGTAGRYLLADVEGPRGAGVPDHVHAREDEWLFVLDGEIRLRLPGEERLVGAAEPVVLQRNVPHGFAVASASARLLTLWDPAGLDRTLRALADPGDGTPSLARDDVAALLAGGGVTLL